MKTTVSQKGQVTIPKAIRDRFGLHDGSVIEFRMEAGKLIVVKLAPRDPLDKWRGRGRLPNGKSVDEYLKIARDENCR
jgi:antitoxin PrlF